MTNYELKKVAISNVLMLNLTLAFLSLRSQTAVSPVLAKTGGLSLVRSSILGSVSPLVFGRNIHLLIDRVRVTNFLQTAIVVNQANMTYAGYYTQRPPDLAQNYDVIVLGSWFVGCSAGAPYDHGGAISVVSGTLDVTNSLFVNCTTVRQSANGGAISSSAQTNSIVNTCFNNCSTRGQGQAFYIENSWTTDVSLVTMQLCSFSSLVYGSSCAYIMDGGGSGAGTLGTSVSSMNATRNSAKSDGGALSLALSYGSGTLNNCNFNSNSGKSILWIMVTNGALSVTLSSLNFAANVANGRGLIEYYGVSPTLSNSVFSANFGTTLCSPNGVTITVTNCLFDYINASGVAAPVVSVTSSPATLALSMFLTDYCYAAVLPSASGTGWAPSSSSSGGGGSSSSSGGGGGSSSGGGTAAAGSNSLSAGLIVTIAICVIELLVIVAILLILVIFIRRSSWGKNSQARRSPPRRRRHYHHEDEEQANTTQSESSQPETEMDTEQIPDETGSTEPEPTHNRRRRRIRRRRKVEDDDEADDTEATTTNPSEATNDSGSPLISKGAPPVPLRRANRPTRQKISLDWSSEGED